MRLSLVLPCYNEEENIEKTLRDTASWMSADGVEGEIIAVNDGSRDGTGAKLEALRREIPQLKIVTHRENAGYGAALRSGLDAATGDILGFMDSDGQFDPRDFSTLLPLLSDVPFVTGRRRKRADPFMRKMNAKLFGFLSFAVLGIWVRDINCAMKLWKKDVWKTIRPECASGALFNAELFYRLKMGKIPWKQVDVPHYPRRFGTQTGANLQVILRMFRELWALRRGGK